MAAPPPPPPGAPPPANVAAGAAILATKPAAAPAPAPAPATPTSAAGAKPATPVAAKAPAPVSGGIAARTAALNASAAAAPPPSVDRQASTPKGNVAAKFQAATAPAPTPAAGAGAGSGAAASNPGAPKAGLSVSGNLAGKMNALALNPGLLRAGSTKKSMADIMFEKFDADGSGTIDDGEMHLLCNKMGYLITASETKLVVKALDLDGSGKIDKNEFKIWWNRDDRWTAIKLDEKDLAVRQSASEAFSSYDSEGKGVIGKKDYDAFYTGLVEKKLTTKTKEAVFGDLDKNGDGSISFAEYCEWLEKIGTVKVKVLTQAMIDGAKTAQLRGATGLHPAILKDGGK